MSWLDAPAASGARRVWTVAALVQAVGDTLGARYGDIVLRGEVCNFTRAASGHGYFSLKDQHGQALVRCAMFRRALSQVDFPLSEGLLLEARGRLSVYEARGELQLVVEGLQRAGAGALYEQFLRLKARLEAEGLFDVARKRPIAPLPTRVAVVTSLAAAALRDVATTLRRRAPHVEALILPCAVQGAEAPEQIVQALRRAAVLAGRQGPARIDTVLLCRGGGSLEDLWAFNDERVVRAVAASPVPVVCGVGHETDVTLADLAADLRAPTPTAAAELIARPREEVLSELQALQTALQWRVHQRVDQAGQRLDRVSLRLSRPSRLLHQQHQRLGNLGHRLSSACNAVVGAAQHALPLLARRHARAVAHQLAWDRQALSQLDHRLRALDPQRVLERGYAWVSTQEGTPVTRAGQAQPGQAVRIEMADGRLDADVRGVWPRRGAQESGPTQDIEGQAGGGRP